MAGPRTVEESLSTTGRGVEVIRVHSNVEDSLGEVGSVVQGPVWVDYGSTICSTCQSSRSTVAPRPRKPTTATN